MWPAPPPPSPPRCPSPSTPTPPAAPVIAATITPDTGSSATDRITNDNTPTLHGTAEAGDTVTLYDTDGTTVIATTTADVNGNWSVPTSALGNGTHSITATATDVAGTTSAISTALSIAIDTHTPAAPVIAATITPDTGSSATDRITNDNTPTLHGTAEAGDTVTLYDTDGTTVIATTTADVNGNWSVPTSALGNGTHSIIATATDVAGTTSAISTALSVTIDTHTPAAPTIAATITPDTGSSATDRITSATTPTLHGTAEAGSTVTLYDTDGTTVLATVVADESGNWSVATSALGNGTHSITATATDQAGNISVASSLLSVTIDTHTPAAPTIAATITPDTGSSATDRITSATTPMLHGTAEAGDTVTLYDTDGTTVIATTNADGSGNWSVATSALGNGTHSITATATDVAGTVSAASTALSVTIDTHTPAAPTIAATITPDTGSSDTDRITNDNTPTLHGTAEAGDTVTLYDTDGTTVLATTTADVNGNWSVATSALGNGTHSITATATDVAGTTSAISTALLVTIDTHTPAAPTIASLTPATNTGIPGVTSDPAPTLTGTGEPGDTVTLYDGTTVIGTTTVSAGGAWSLATPVLPDGVHPLTATVTDTAGSVSPASASFALTIDTHIPAAPVITGLTAATDTGAFGVTSNRMPVVLGTAEPGSTVTLYDGTAVLGTTTANSAGQWTFAVAAPLADGPHALTATATDAAATVGAHSQPLDLSIVPTVLQTIPAQTWNGGSLNVLDVPPGTFDIPTGDRPLYQALLVNADGSVAGRLPPWLSINPLTGALTGAVPLAATGTLHIQLMLIDDNGDTASTVFDIKYQGPPVPQATLAVTIPAPAAAPPPPPTAAPVQIETIVHDNQPVSPDALPGFVPFETNAIFQPAPTDNAGPPILQTQALTVDAVPDPTPSANGAISYTIGIETPHAGGNGPDSIHLSAHLGDGAPLPSWLKFDPTTRTISGLPPPGTRPVAVVITASDNQGHSARTVVHLGKGETKPGRALDGAGSKTKGLHSSLLPDRHGRTERDAAALVDLRTLRGEPAHPSVRQGLTEQIRSAHRASQIVHQAAMLRAAEQMLHRS